MKLLKISVAAVMVTLLLPVAGLAHNGEDHHTTTERPPTAQERIEALEARRREAAENRQQVISEVQNDTRERFKQSCEARKSSYQARLTGIANRAERHINIVDKIVERVKAFVNTNNLSVTNYEALTADVEAKSLVAHNLQEAIKLKATEAFSCERGVAIENARVFGDILAQQTDAFKEYKASVKDLIVAVKTAASQRDTNEN